MACLSSATGASVSQVVMGAIQVYIVDDTGWDYSTLSLAVTAGTWCSGVLSPLAGAWADRYGPRVLTTLGLLAVGCALLALSAVNTGSLWPFFVAYVVARTLSNPLLIGIVPRTATVNFFRRRRGVTLAINGMARPVGGAINIQIISLIAATHSWRASYGYVGLFMLAMTVPVFLIMRRTPEEIGMLPDGDRPAVGSDHVSRAASGRGPARRTQSGTQEFSWTAREAMKTRAYWCIAGTAVLAITASAGLGYILVPFLVSEMGPGLSNQQAVGVGSLGAVLALTTLVWGFLADRFGPRPCMVATIAGAVLSGLFLAIGVHGVWTAYLFAVLWGFFSNTVGTLEHMLLAQYFGRGSFGVILGTLGPLQTGALGLAPVFGNLLLAFTQSYSLVFVILMAMYAGAGLLILLAKAPRLPPRATQAQAEPGVASATV